MEGIGGKNSIVYSIVAIVFLQLGVLSLIFPLPLQILYERHGYRAFLVQGIMSLIAGLLLKTILMFLAGVDVASLLFWLEMLFPAGLFIGCIMVNHNKGLNIRILYRLLGATVLVGILTAPVLLTLSTDHGFIQNVRTEFDSAWGEMVRVMGLQDNMLDTGDMTATGAQVFDMMLDSFRGSYLALFFLVLGLNIRLGERFSKVGRTSDSWRGFHVPDWFVWPYMASLLLFFLGGLQDRLEVGFLPWWIYFPLMNLSLIFLFLFFFQGVGIILVLLDRIGFGRIANSLLWFLLLMFLLIETTQQIFFMALGLLGASEL